MIHIDTIWILFSHFSIIKVAYFEIIKITLLLAFTIWYKTSYVNISLFLVKQVLQNLSKVRSIFHSQTYTQHLQKYTHTFNVKKLINTNTLILSHKFCLLIPNFLLLLDSCQICRALAVMYIALTQMLYSFTTSSSFWSAFFRLKKVLELVAPTNWKYIKDFMNI